MSSTESCLAAYFSRYSTSCLGCTHRHFPRKHNTTRVPTSRKVGEKWGTQSVVSSLLPRYYGGL